MSIAAVKWARAVKTGSPTNKAVLLILADHAGPSGQAWPSVSTIANDAELKERTVQYALRDLAASGFISIEEGTGKGGRGNCARYSLNLEQIAPAAAPPRKGAPGASKGAPRAPIAAAAELRKGASDDTKGASDCIKGARGAPEPYRTVEEPEETSLRDALEPPRGVVEVIPPKPVDVRTSLFREGLAKVRQMTGLPDGRARGILGQLLKASGDNAATVSEVVAAAHDLRPADPVAWMMGAVKARKSQFAWMLEPDAVENSDALAAQSQYAWCVPHLLNDRKH